MKHIRLTFLMIFLSGICFGQETLNLSLNEAIDYALQYNKTLQNERLNVKIAESKIKEAIAAGLPQIDATVDWMTYFNYEMEFNLDMGSDVTFTPEQLQQAAEQTLAAFPGNQALGLNAVTYQDLYNYSAGQSYSNLLTSMLPPTTIKMTDASTAQIQLGQLLFSGQYYAGIKAAKLAQKISEQGYDNSVIEIKEAITNSYLMALVTNESVKVMDKTISNLSKIKSHTEEMYKAGVAEQTDIDQIQIQVVMLENTKRSMERGLKMIYSMLKLQLGLDTSSEVELSEDIETIMARINPKGNIQTQDITSNILFQLTATQEEISEKMLEMEKWSYAPTITGFYAYNEKLKTTGFDMTPNHMAGVTMNVPIFSSGTRKQKLEQAKIGLDQARLNKSVVEDQLKLQETQLILDLKTAIENYDSQEENVAVAKRAFENIERKYQQGIVSSLDLTQANSNYLQAETNYIQSLMTLLQAKVALDKLYNKL